MFSINPLSYNLTLKKLLVIIKCLLIGSSMCHLGDRHGKNRGVLIDGNFVSYKERVQNEILKLAFFKKRVHFLFQPIACTFLFSVFKIERKSMMSQPRR